MSRFTKGAEVYGNLGPGPNGTYAEYLVVAADILAAKPHSLSHAEAAAVPVAATTAWQALFEYANLRAGQRVLVHGAAGGVGHLAVQLAHWKGAHVIGTASARNEEFLKGLGVNEFIDYENTAFEQVLHNLDVVFDTVGGETAARSWPVLKPGGFFVSSVGAANEEQAQAHRARSANFQVSPDAGQLAQLALLLDEGRLKISLQQTFPLAEAAAAQALGRQGHVRGKLVLPMNGA